MNLAKPIEVQLRVWTRAGSQNHMIGSAPFLLDKRGADLRTGRGNFCLVMRPGATITNRITYRLLKPDMPQLHTSRDREMSNTQQNIRTQIHVTEKNK